jgi:soluble lytic murein transglycosylase
LYTDYYKAWAAYILGIYVDNSMFSTVMHLRPGSYYSFRAALRLNEDTENILKKPLRSIASLAPVADSVLYELCSLDYTAELEYVCQSALRLSADEWSAGYLFLLSKLAYANGDPYRGITFAENLLSTLDSPALLSLPREILELLYPKVFVDLITDSLKDRETEMELFLVLSIVREESRYNSAARSSKGALGLMQLMPDTASWILRDEISAVQLLQPSVNISAGTTYLDYLYRRFDITEYVVASYNGGPNNVGKWISRSRGRSLEEFIEEIPYRETRNFVKKVYTSYQMYRFLYGDDPFIVD